MVAEHLQEKKGLYYIVLSYLDKFEIHKTKWIPTGFSTKGNNIVSKQSLAAFIASSYGQSIAVQSMRHKELMANFCEEMQNSDMTFGIMSL